LNSLLIFFKKPILLLACERSGEYKASKRKVKHEGTSLRKCRCLFRLHGNLWKEDNEWWLSTFNEIHNYKMESVTPYLFIRLFWLSLESFIWFMLFILISNMLMCIIILLSGFILLISRINNKTCRRAELELIRNEWC